MTLSRYDRDLVYLFALLAPQLSYADSRDDGMASRVDLALHKLRSVPGLVTRRGEGYRVPSHSAPGAFHTVYLDGEDGQHSCTCRDSTRWSACWHILSVCLAIHEGLVDVATMPALAVAVDELWGER